MAILRQSSRESPSQRVKRPRSLLQSPIPGKGLLARSFRAKGRTGGTCWKSRFAGTAATSNHGGLHAVRDPKRAEGRSVLHILNAGSLDTKREAYRKISQRRMSQASTKRGDCGPVVDQQTMRMAPNSRMTDSTSVSCRWAINPKSTPEAANAFSIIRWRYLSPILALRSLLVRRRATQPLSLPIAETNASVMGATPIFQRQVNGLERWRGGQRASEHPHSRSQYCVRPSSETPMNPRTFSFLPPSCTESWHL